jgi:hypothetical protein
MPRKRNHFRQRDVSRLLRAHKAAGVPQPIIKVDPDGALIAMPADRPEPDASTANPWDEVLTDAAHEKRAS